MPRRLTFLAPLSRLQARQFPRHVPRRTARLKLTLFYGGLFLVSGVVLLVITNILVRSTTGNLIFFRMPGNGLPFDQNGPRGRAIFNYQGVVRHHPVPPQLSGQLSKAEALALQTHAADLHQLAVQSAIALGAMTVLSAVLGWLVAGRVLRPLRSITATARRISANNLHERLALEGPDDEFKELGDTLDGLLGRLESSFDAQRRFVANASHELRTPLTLERTLLQLALDDPGATVASLRSTCEELLVYGEAQERLIEALLTLAASEQGLDQRQPVDLAAIAELVVASPHPEADRLDVSLDSDVRPAATTGDPRLVERLVANLVHNALRHNVAGGWARVRTGTRGGLAVLSVMNSGPVVDSGDIERLFQPFQRLDGSRSGQSDGHGLGLAIVKAIAIAHGATIRVTARLQGGLAVEVGFPVVPSGTVVIAGDRAAAGDRAGGDLPAPEKVGGGRPGGHTPAGPGRELEPAKQGAL
jgi:signal transduction histidine kinase